MTAPKLSTGPPSEGESSQGSVSRPPNSEGIIPTQEVPDTPPGSRRERWVSFVGWMVAVGMVLFAVYVWQVQAAPPSQLSSEKHPAPTTLVEEVSPPATIQALPVYHFSRGLDSIARAANLHTRIPNRPNTRVIQYTVETGDSVFGIAQNFNIKPETVLWANYDLLNDNPDFLEQGMELNIPPVDGVYYEWSEGDTLEGVAEKFEANVEDILEFTGNGLDLAEPTVDPGTLVMIPGGHREFRQWLIPTIPRGAAGVSLTAFGPGACSGSFEGAYGSGAFVWPTSNHFLSGNDYWSGHLGLDLAAGYGAGVFASDSGVVVFAGWANGGYGNTILIDHGNGYQTLYGHLSQVNVPCGASVYAGNLIGLSGSTGNSTGPHLHFEVRLNGGFVNPWFVLPPP